MAGVVLASAPPRALLAVPFVPPGTRSAGRSVRRVPALHPRKTGVAVPALDHAARALLAVALITPGTGTAPWSLLRVNALGAWEARVVVTASAHACALVAASGVALGAGTAAGTLCCVMAMDSWKAVRRVSGAGGQALLRGLFAQFAVFEEVAQCVDRCVLFPALGGQDVDGFYQVVESYQNGT